MYKFNIFRSFLLSLSIIFVFSFIFFNFEVHAMEATYYSYDEIQGKLPKKYRNATYLTQNGDITYLSFATYEGNDYRTSVKKSKSKKNYLYCINRSKPITLNKQYMENPDFFNKNLRNRLALAFYYGTTEWGKLADSTFSTNNSLLDYYMTQTVVHALIFKYGGKKSDYGIDFSKIVYKDDVAKLASQTKKLFNFCCKATIQYSDGTVKASEFEFQPDTAQNLYLDGNNFISPTISCKINSDNAAVKEFNRDADKSFMYYNQLQILSDSDKYDSAFHIQIPYSAFYDLLPGKYTFNINEKVVFSKQKTMFWNCVEDSFIDNQQLGGFVNENVEVSDTVPFNLIVGNAIIYKKDSITGDTIEDAEFELQQYNDTTNQFEFYRKFTYNYIKQYYDSGKIFALLTNSTRKFRIIESQPGKGYINDWQGEVFTLTDDTYMFEFDVENQPILGTFHLEKKGEQFTLLEDGFDVSSEISLSDIKFGLYASEDIYVKSKLIYNKDSKIADLITNEKGEADVSDLVPGTYHIKEIETNNLYTIDDDTYEFTIKRDNLDESHKYSIVDYININRLKKCNIEIFKYYLDEKGNEKKIPLSDVKFGLYAKEDILDANNIVVVPKDTLIKTELTDKDGKAVFEKLPYADYYIKELEAPEYFIINDGIVPIVKENFIYDNEKQCYYYKQDIIEYYGAATPQIRQSGNRLSGLAETACASLLA